MSWWNTHKRAEKQSFRLVPETCPHVDSALEEAARAIKLQTGELREALIETLIEKDDLADQLNSALETIEELKREVAELIEPERAK